MDIYLEFIIKQKYTFSKVLAVILLYLTATVLSLGVFFVAVRNAFIMQFSVFIMAVFYLSAWWLSKKLCVEYEYIVTNDELDVDRIVAKNSRKRMLTVSAKKFEEFGVAQDDVIKKKKDSSVKVVLDASIGKGSFNRYYAIFNNKQGKKMLLIFNPTSKMIDALRIYNPRVINV